MAQPGKPKGADICVIGGAGHVGLPLSLVLAACGKRVLIHDTNARALELIGRGEMPFMERGADGLLREGLAKGRLGLSSDPAAVAGVPTLIITIGTPIDEFHSPTVRSVKGCIDDLIPFLTGDQLLVLRSTVYPGFTNWLNKYLLSHGKNLKLSFCPERIVQGNAVEEIEKLPQIVSGMTPEAEEAAARLFGLLTKRIVRLSPTEAEFAKLFCNAYRYVEFAAANQFYMMTTSAGVDYYRVLEGLKLDYPRAGHIPGAGLSAGPCLFKDTMQLTAFFRNHFSIGHSAMLANEGMPAFIVEQLQRRHRLADLTVGLLGMAFKADSDDRRSSLSYKLKKLIALHAKAVLTTDPHVKDDPELLSLEEVIDRSDLMVLCAPHKVYRNLDAKGKEVLDIWNFLPGRETTH